MERELSMSSRYVEDKMIIRLQTCVFTDWGCFVDRSRNGPRGGCDCTPTPGRRGGLLNDGRHEEKLKKNLKKKRGKKEVATASLNTVWRA